MPGSAIPREIHYPIWWHSSSRFSKVSRVIFESVCYVMTLPVLLWSLASQLSIYILGFERDPKIIVTICFDRWEGNWKDFGESCGGWKLGSDYFFINNFFNNEYRIDRLIWSGSEEFYLGYFVSSKPNECEVKRIVAWSVYQTGFSISPHLSTPRQQRSSLLPFLCVSS